MANVRRKRPSWKRRGSPIGRKAPRTTHPRYSRTNSKHWSDQDLRRLRTLAKGNTPTRVIGLKLGRSEGAVRGKALREGISLKPTNQSPYNRLRNALRRVF